ncbi:TetR/AcrR family transcriptional regulator C-terminal domain-containing protein [Agrobacterium pusense]|uniref:TetR/AcrR family transcriptional regulator C-terminal domain-containing protein n=1 Tax=Agrobacterium pusense TaxID=648995 RepID=UPI003FCF3303
MKKLPPRKRIKGDNLFARCKQGRTHRSGNPARIRPHDHRRTVSSVRVTVDQGSFDAFGTRYLNFINGRELHGWDRLIASASTAHPDLPRKFFDAGPGRGQKMLTEIIAKALSKGELCALDPGVAADDLTGLWLGFVNLEIKLGARQPLTDAEIQHKVARGVDLFLKIYGPSDTVSR